MLNCICQTPLQRNVFSKKFDLMRCPKCGSGKFVDIGTETLTEYNYDSNDDKYGNQTYLNKPEFRWAHFELAKQEWTGQDVLEIGCFTGFFLDKLRSLGAKVSGVEVNSKALAAGEQLYGLKGQIFPSLEAIPVSQFFDRILLIDVLEHIDQPAGFIDAVSALLKPGGSLSISSPTIERRLHDKSDFPPHHQWWFSRQGLRSLVALRGLDPVGSAVQHDGMLLMRNFIGRVLHGFSKREFNGEGSEAVSAMARSGDGTRLYMIATRIGDLALRTIGMQYCSYLLHARKTGS